MEWWNIYAAVLIVTLLLSVGMTYLWRELGRRLEFTDRPHREAHKRHDRPIPLLGGAAMFSAWALTVAGGLLLYSAGADWIRQLFPGVATPAAVTGRLAVIAGGALCLAIVGLVDDIRPLPAGTKFISQFVVAAVVAAFGIRIQLFFTNPILTWGLTVFWMLFIINAINFFDNMDALAGGCAVVAAFFFTVVAGLREQYYVAVLGASLCGTACGFLFYNWPPASIFMGDSGSHFLGYMLAVLGASTTFYVPGETPTPAPLLIPLLVLALPIFDTFAVVFIRLRVGHPIYRGDNRHISHRFVQLGLSRRCSVILILLLAIAMGAGATTLLWVPPAGALIVFLQTAVILTFVSILHVKGKRPSC